MNSAREDRKVEKQPELLTKRPKSLSDA